MQHFMRSTSFLYASFFLLFSYEILELEGQLETTVVFPQSLSLFDVCRLFELYRLVSCVLLEKAIAPGRHTKLKDRQNYIRVILIRI